MGLRRLFVLLLKKKSIPSCEAAGEITFYTVLLLLL